MAYSRRGPYLFISDHWSLMKASKKGGKLSAITSARKAQKTRNTLIHLKNQLFLKAAELILKCPKFFLVISDKWPKFLREKKQPRYSTGMHQHGLKLILRLNPQKLSKS